MAGTITGLRDRARSPGGKKAMRYTMVSVIAVAVSQVVLVVLFGVLGWSETSANVAAVTIGGVPSYILNRRWVWGKSGKSHLWREVVPFWALAFAGLALSTVAVAFAGSYARDNFDSHLLRTLSVMAANIGAFGVLWVGKFFLFNYVLFVDHD